MMQSPASITNDCSSYATIALEKQSHCRRSSGINKSEQIENGETKKSLYNVDKLFHSMILISDQPYHFPAIEWCFDDDINDIPIVPKGYIGTALDHERPLQFGTHSRDLVSYAESTQQQIPRILRCTARTNLGDFLQCVEPKISVTSLRSIRK
jgi:hypothetical protein